MREALSTRLPLYLEWRLYSKIEESLPYNANFYDCKEEESLSNMTLSSAYKNQCFDVSSGKLTAPLLPLLVANMIRFLVDSYNKQIPAILEIPSKDHPYDPAHDSILSPVKYLFSTESVASERR
ncbi:hypothetical protein KY285_009973 [Solanum tuberosum]|nr:hypothetical protein KY285_009973 [Solanum tuberosum]